MAAQIPLFHGVPMTDIPVTKSTNTTISVPPVGYDQICAEFGNIDAFVQPDGTICRKWEDLYIGKYVLPFPMKLAWDHSKKVSSIACHVRLVGKFSAVFTDIVDMKLEDKVQYYGGCYNFRAKRGSNRYSTHSWGIAIDINPATNRQGTHGDMDYTVVKIFNAHGFTWGGSWGMPYTDAMHFQFASGY
jgi:D-alanyl-D-alanine carboxypeptidase